MFKPCLPGHAVRFLRGDPVHIAQVAAVVTEELEAAMLVDAGIRGKVIAIDGLKVEFIGPALVAGGIGPVADLPDDIIDIIACGDRADDERGSFRLKRSN